MNTLGPPVKAGSRANTVWLALEDSAVGKLGVLQVLDGGEVLVDERGVGQWP